MDNTMIELCETFIAESLDYIDEMEPAFIGLAQAVACQDQPTFQNLMNHIFRLMHTIKGSAGSLGFKNITDLAHSAENLLDAIRLNRIALTPHRLHLLTQSLDVFRRLLAVLQVHRSDEGQEHLIQALQKELKDANKDEAAPQAPSPGLPAMQEVSPGLYVFDEDPPQVKNTPALRQAFTQEADENISKVETLLLGFAEAAESKRRTDCAEALRILHSFKGNCGFMQFHDLVALVHAMETALSKIDKDGDDKRLMEALLKSLDTLKAAIEQVAAEKYPEIRDLAPLLAALGEEVTLTPAQLLASEDKAGTKESAQQQAAANVRSDVRVDLRKLDLLINLVGELVVAEAMISTWAQSLDVEDEGLEHAIHHLRRTANNLQDVAMSVRMVPVNPTFKKMVRLVHDTSQKLQKKVRLNVLGEETEVDKTVIEQIADPLVHCVRNSIDHGLETPAERLKAGKEETGTVTLEARHEGGEVWITVRDDGRGLDRDKILQRAIARGLVPSEKESSLSDSEIYGFIFEPGFSTAEQVTDISGRGVGMDVVRKNIEKVKGRVRVESVPGHGSCVTFQIPLTLAIIDGMMIRVGSSMYTIPLLSIQESIRVFAEQVTVGPDGQAMLDVRSNFIPIVRLDELMKQDSPEERRAEFIVVVVEVNGKSIALLVDEILGQQQTVIKALPAIYQHSRNVSGCSILGNGDVSLILDVSGISQSLTASYDSLIANAA